MMKAASMFALKTVVFWVAILIASIVAAMALGLENQALPDDGPLDSVAAFLLVNGLHALVLSAIAARAAIGGWKLGVLLGSTLFFAQSFLLIIEAFYFANSVSTPAEQLMASSLVSLAAASSVALVAILLWRRRLPISRADLNIRQLIVQVPGVALLYALLYFSAGYFIAWAAPQVRAFYGDGLEIDPLNLMAFQIFRGTVWSLLALALVRSLKPGRLTAAVIVGACFATLASAQLLYPNPFMPWEVRQFHLVEIFLSNFVFGVIAALVFGRKQ